MVIKWSDFISYNLQSVKKNPYKYVDTIYKKRLI